ncbi:MAG: hypothetical protein IPK16_26335 [Anaerolineales bacterium]|nr:hypothetical protein [Anaerolineales bacterium]
MQTAVNEPAGGANRLAAVKRIYLYVVAFVSLAAMLASADSLLGFLSRAWLGDVVIVTPRAVASSAGLLLVATPIFLLHWGLAQRGHETPEERDSVLRKLFLYLASALSVIFLAINVYSIVDGSIAILLGADRTSNDLLVAWPQWVLFGAVNAALVGYWAHVLRTDGDFGTEHRGGRVVRQLYTLIAGFSGLVLILWGGASLVNVLLTLAVDQWSNNLINGYAWWATSISGACAQLLVGSWVAWANRAQWREVVKIHPMEGQAPSRRIYLYIAIVLGAIATLTPAALVLREGLLMLFGTGGGELVDLLRRMITPISFVPIGLGIWIWHSRVLHQEAAAFGESQQGAAVRRLYFYLVAATGLALTWVGAVELLNAVLDWVISSGDRIWTQPLANGLSLIAVGAPVWALHWRGATDRTPAEYPGR